MPGVLGGKPGINIGDIIVSNKVFTIDKGKLTTQEIIDESSDKHTEVKIVKKEIESVNVSSSYVSKFTREKDNILSFIRKEDVTRKSKVDILFGPVACVRQVIDQKEFFEENILVVDRKAIGLEMESYGIARACELVNNGKTIPLIIKAVMDNTSEKTDNDKTYAAWTSAMFIRYILENDLI
jgi:nucleoside phosphorylase